MLVDPESNQIKYRFKLRSESADQMAAQVRDQVKHLLGLAERVNTKWVTDRAGEKLHLEIRLYDGFLLGPYYQVGQDVLFVGMNLSHQSAAWGPMVEVTRLESGPWIA